MNNKFCPQCGSNLNRDKALRLGDVIVDDLSEKQSEVGRLINESIRRRMNQRRIDVSENGVCIQNLYPQQAEMIGEILNREREKLARIESHNNRTLSKVRGDGIEEGKRNAVDDAVKSGAVVCKREHKNAVEEARAEGIRRGRVIEEQISTASAVGRIESIAQLCAEALEEL